MAFKNILVATDFGDTSQAALASARQLAHAFGSALHVLHIAGNVVAEAVSVEGYTTDYVALQREVEQAARASLEGIVTDEDRRALSARAVVITADTPAPAIVSYAKDARIDLIVVGTHGRGRGPYEPLGSIAERVVRTAPCPVLVVRPAPAPAGGTTGRA